MVWVLDSGTHPPPQAGSVLRTSSLPVRCSPMGNGLQTGSVGMASSPARPWGTLVPSVLEASTGCSALLPAPSWGPCGEAVVSPPNPHIPPYQGIFRYTQDHIVQHGSAAKVLGYGQAAQAVAGVVEVPGPARMQQLSAGTLCSPPALAQPPTTRP